MRMLDAARMAERRLAPYLVPLSRFEPLPVAASVGAEHTTMRSVQGPPIPPAVASET